MSQSSDRRSHSSRTSQPCSRPESIDIDARDRDPPGQQPARPGSPSLGYESYSFEGEQALTGPDFHGYNFERNSERRPPVAPVAPGSSQGSPVLDQRGPAYDTFPPQRRPSYRQPTMSQMPINHQHPRLPPYQPQRRAEPIDQDYYQSEPPSHASSATSNVPSRRPYPVRPLNNQVARHDDRTLDPRHHSHAAPQRRVSGYNGYAHAPRLPAPPVQNGHHQEDFADSGLGDPNYPPDMGYPTYPTGSNEMTPTKGPYTHDHLMDLLSRDNQLPFFPLTAPQIESLCQQYHSLADQLNSLGAVVQDHHDLSAELAESKRRLDAFSDQTIHVMQVNMRKEARIEKLEAEIEVLQEKVGEAEKRAEEIREELRKEFERWKEETEGAHMAEKRALEAGLEETRRKLEEDMESKQKALEEDYATREKEHEDRHVAELEKLMVGLSEAEAGWKEAEERYKSDYAELGRELNSTMKIMEQDFAKQKEDMEEKYERERREVEEEQKQKILKLGEIFGSQKSEMREGFEKEKENMRTEFSTEKLEMQETFEKMKALMQEMFDKEKTSMEERFAVEKSAIESAFSAKEEQTRAEFAAEKKALEDSFASEKEVLLANFDAEKKALEASYASEKTQMAETFAAEKSSMEASFAATKADLEASFNTIKSKLETDYETMKTEMQSLLDTSKSAWDAERNTLTVEFAEQKARLETTIADLEARRKALEEDKNKIEEEGRVVREELERELARVQGMVMDLEIDKESLNKENSKLQRVLRRLGDVEEGNEVKSKGDSYYREAFDMLHKSIIDLSHDFTRISSDSLPESTLSLLPPSLPSKLLTPDTPSSRLLRQSLVQHLISTHLVQKIFTPFIFSLSKSSSGPQIDAFLHSISTDIRKKSIRREALWRIYTLSATFTSASAREQVSAYAKQVQADIVEAISPFTVKEKMDKVRNAVARIVKLAVETWRYARMEKEIFGARLEFWKGDGEAEWGRHAWKDCKPYRDNAELVDTVRTNAPRGGRGKVLALLPIIAREGTVPSAANPNIELDDGMTFTRGVALYEDDLPLLHRKAELSGTLTLTSRRLSASPELIDRELRLQLKREEKRLQADRLEQARVEKELSESEDRNDAKRRGSDGSAGSGEEEEFDGGSVCDYSVVENSAMFKMKAERERRERKELERKERQKDEEERIAREVESDNHGEKAEDMGKSVVAELDNENHSDTEQADEHLSEVTLPIQETEQQDAAPEISEPDTVPETASILAEVGDASCSLEETTSEPEHGAPQPAEDTQSAQTQDAEVPNVAVAGLEVPADQFPADSDGGVPVPTASTQFTDSKEETDKEPSVLVEEEKKNDADVFQFIAVEEDASVEAGAEAGETERDGEIAEDAQEAPTQRSEPEPVTESTETETEYKSPLEDDSSVKDELPAESAAEPESPTSPEDDEEGWSQPYSSRRGRADTDASTATKDTAITTPDSSPRATRTKGTKKHQDQGASKNRFGIFGW